MKRFHLGTEKDIDTTFLESLKQLMVNRPISITAENIADDLSLIAEPSETYLREEEYAIQYLTDEQGETTSMQIAIKDWEAILAKFPKLEEHFTADVEIPEWQIKEVMSTLSHMEKHPEDWIPLKAVKTKLNDLRDGV